MFSPTQKIREYRAEQKRHAQIAREIDDALTNRQMFTYTGRPDDGERFTVSPIGPAYRQQIVNAQRRLDVAGVEIAAKGLHSLHKMQERLGANAGY